MPRKKDITSPKKGMNRDKAQFDLAKTEYSFMLNGNFQDEHGSGQINLQNEPSNIFCSGFKDGYKVILKSVTCDQPNKSKPMKFSGNGSK